MLIDGGYEMLTVPLIEMVTLSVTFIASSSAVPPSKTMDSGVARSTTTRSSSSKSRLGCGWVAIKGVLLSRQDGTAQKGRTISVRHELFSGSPASLRDTHRCSFAPRIAHLSKIPARTGKYRSSLMTIALPHYCALPGPHDSRTMQKENPLRGACATHHPKRILFFLLYKRMIWF